jgi:GNAT superfamily N-acetyltransferase
MPGPGGDGVNIRPARESDAAAIAALAGQLGYPATEAEMKARLADAEHWDDHVTLVAEDGPTVVGWAHGAWKLSIESGWYAELEGLVVDENKRSGGIGAALVAEIETWAKKKGAARLRVRSNVIRERAHAFYERLGFRLSKTQKVFDKIL